MKLRGSRLRTGLAGALLFICACSATVLDGQELARRYEDFRGDERDRNALDRIRVGLAGATSLATPSAQVLEMQLFDLLQRHPCHLGILRALQDVRVRGGLAAPLLDDLNYEACAPATSLYLIARGTADLELARKNLELALAIDPDFPHARALRGLLELASGDKMGRAVRDLEAGHQAFPNDMELLLALAEAHERRFDPAGALPVYRELLARDPMARDVRMNLGLALLELGSWREALSEFRRVAKDHPAYVDAHHAVGAALVLGAQWKEAEQHFQELQRNFPEDAEAWFSLGGLYFDGPLRDRARSEACYRAFLQALESEGRASPNQRAALTYLADLERDGRTTRSASSDRQ